MYGISGLNHFAWNVADVNMNHWRATTTKKGQNINSNKKFPLTASDNTGKGAESDTAHCCNTLVT